MAGTGSVLVPKGPRVGSSARPESTAPEFDRTRTLEVLFALPVPPPPRSGSRNYPIHTPLGRVMRLRGVTIEDLVRLNAEGVPHSRTISELLSGRKDVSPAVARAIGGALGVDWRVLVTIA